jgi:hypothetical protein
MGGEAWGGGRGVSAAIRQRGMASSGPAMTFVGGARPALKQGRAGEVTDGPLYSPRWRRFEYISNSNEFKTFQSLTNPKMAFPNPKKLK